MKVTKNSIEITSGELRDFMMQHPPYVYRWIVEIIQKLTGVKLRRKDL